jgi:hypothetical protein
MQAVSREERIARNEAWTRSLNEAHAKWAGGQLPMAGFRCECWHAECTERLPLSGEDWKLVRAEPNRFAVAPDHVVEDLEVVVEEFAHFWVVEKLGKAGEIAERLAAADG